MPEKSLNFSAIYWFKGEKKAFNYLTANIYFAQQKSVPETVKRWLRKDKGSPRVGWFCFVFFLTVKLNALKSAQGFARKEQGILI